MLALLPLVLSLAPEIAKWIGGDAAGDVAQKAADVVQSVTGTTDPAQVGAVIADPAKAAELRVRLAQIAADQEKAARDDQLAALTAQLKDVADARAQTVSLAGAHSGVQWAPAVVSVVVLGTFGLVMWAALTRSLPPGSETILTMLLGTLAAMASSVVGYWVGSSAGSAQKNNLLYRSTPANVEKQS